MQVDSINSYQPSFNGYLGKNIQTYVNYTVEKEVNSIVRYANYKMKPVDVDKIKGIKQLGDEVLDKFRKYVTPLNKNTVLDMEDDLESSFIRCGFKNIIFPGKNIKIYHSRVLDKASFYGDNVSVPISYVISKLSSSSARDLSALNNVADELYKIPAKKIDKVFYLCATAELKERALNTTGFISKFVVRKWAKALDKFAQSIGIEGSNRVRAEEYFRRAKEAKELAKSNEKLRNKITKENQKKAEEILKG